MVFFNKMRRKKYMETAACRKSPEPLRKPGLALQPHRPIAVVEGAAAVTKLSVCVQPSECVPHTKQKLRRHSKRMVRRDTRRAGSRATFSSDCKYACGSVDGKYAVSIPLYARSPVKRYPLSSSQKHRCPANAPAYAGLRRVFFQGSMYSPPRSTFVGVP